MYPIDGEATKLEVDFSSSISPSSTYIRADEINDDGVEEDDEEEEDDDDEAEGEEDQDDDDEDDDDDDEDEDDEDDNDEDEDEDDEDEDIDDDSNDVRNGVHATPGEHQNQHLMQNGTHLHHPHLQLSPQHHQIPHDEPHILKHSHPHQHDLQLQSDQFQNDGNHTLHHPPYHLNSHHQQIQHLHQHHHISTIDSHHINSPTNIAINGHHPYFISSADQQQSLEIQDEHDFHIHQRLLHTQQALNDHNININNNNDIENDYIIQHNDCSSIDISVSNNNNGAVCTDVTVNHNNTITPTPNSTITSSTLIGDDNIVDGERMLEVTRKLVRSTERDPDRDLRKQVLLKTAIKKLPHFMEYNRYSDSLEQSFHNNHMSPQACYEHHDSQQKLYHSVQPNAIQMSTTSLRMLHINDDHDQEFISQTDSASLLETSLNSTNEFYHTSHDSGVALFSPRSNKRSSSWVGLDAEMEVDNLTELSSRSTSIGSNNQYKKLRKREIID